LEKRLTTMTSTTESRTLPAIAQWKAFKETKLYDFLAASPLIAWYLLCVASQLPALARLARETDFASIDILTTAHLASKLATLLFVATLGVLLVLRHTPLARTRGFYPRIAAIGGAYLGVGVVLLPARELAASLYLASTGLILGGTVFALYAVTRLGRSLSMLPEARRLVTSGPYASIRHPLYLGEAVALAGLTLQYFSWAAVALFVVQCVFQLERIKNEEKILSRIFPEYRDYMTHTARLVPGLY
jgi:protein-S-isoprenylcysteine O-methyltransferase Ste14